MLPLSRLRCGSGEVRVGYTNVLKLLHTVMGVMAHRIHAIIGMHWCWRHVPVGHERGGRKIMVRREALQRVRQHRDVPVKSRAETMKTRLLVYCRQVGDACFFLLLQARLDFDGPRDEASVRRLGCLRSGS